MLSFGVKVIVDAKPVVSDVSIKTALSKSDPLKTLIMMRCLLVQASLVIPMFAYFVVTDSQINIAWLLLASGCSALFSSWLWGRFADSSATGTVIAASSGAFIGSILLMWTIQHQIHILSVCLFFVLLVCYDGIRLARKVLVMQVTNDSNRLILVGAANTCVGFYLLISGFTFAVLYQTIGQHVIELMVALLGIGVICSVKRRHVFKVKEKSSA